MTISVLLVLQVDLQGIGVSIIEASVTKLGREVMHVQLRRVNFRPKKSLRIK